MCDITILIAYCIDTAITEISSSNNNIPIYFYINTYDKELYCNNNIPLSSNYFK